MPLSSTALFVIAYAAELAANPTEINTRPVAHNDRYVIAPDQVLDVSSADSVLKNDQDAQTPYPDARLSADHVSVETPEAGRLLGFRRDGSFRFQPTPGFQGVFRFSYRARDPEGLSNFAFADIAIGDPPPVIADQQFLVASDDAPGTLIGRLRAFDDGPPGTLRFAAETAGWPFRVRPNGEIRLTETLPAHTRQAIRLPVQVRDPAGGRQSAQVSVAIVDRHTDLSVALQQRFATQLATEPNLYTVQVDNVGLTDLPSVIVLRLTYPDELSLVAREGAGWICDDGQGLRCAWHGLARGMQASPLSLWLQPLVLLDRPVEVSAEIRAVEDQSPGNDLARATTRYRARNLAPVMTNQVFSLPANSLAGTVVGRLQASDDGLPQPDLLLFSALGDTGPFEVSDGGVVTLSRPLSVDDPRRYRWRAEVRDRDLATSAEVRIEISAPADRADRARGKSQRSRADR